MSDEFRELLKRVGSGTHTSKNLTRTETATATKMMLLQEATPAQIGAFAIAHRIKRPTPEELAGILDAFEVLGSKLTVNPHHDYKPVVLGNPYDGRSRTVPVTIITALILTTVNVPVVMHGGDCMPTKYGIPLIEIWQQLGVNFSDFNLAQAQEIYDQSCLGFLYLPQHFPEAHNFVPFREQIGKRPPFATAELAWCPIAGEANLVAGFVHPPTEERFRSAFKIRGTNDFTLVKGLEGSCDLSRSRTAIIAMGRSGSDFERLLLDPHDYNLRGSDILLESKSQVISLTQEVIEGSKSQLLPAAILNGGFYLWRFGRAKSLQEGFQLAADILITGKVKTKLSQLQTLCN
ncbi:anthranilate phosphoribosyltransferase family protein [Waterburya agarophytonicola K14]|uniref:Anthranilate phosphoribosyltransferase family protein n=1 Tax=Waterburya agarophytonicola KI4 TaxID=2874699 RepID=A0A964FH30_9CYAN|nr:anthranilate phosphoribosyltransferase family protein [Waterburya agarophytonicola]MCC0178647.1 anthranilate phosphoribosyltransferase family protein [Waterburya agarophytonicola KI4]